MAGVSGLTKLGFWVGSYICESLKTLRGTANALKFAMMSEEMSDVAYNGAISFIRKIVSPWN